MKWLDTIPYSILVTATIILGLAPFVPKPHLLEKLQMLISGNLHKPIDIVDLFFHSLPFMLLVIKIIREHMFLSKE